MVKSAGYPSNPIELVYSIRSLICLKDHIVKVPALNAEIKIESIIKPPSTHKTFYSPTYPN